VIFAVSDLRRSLEFYERAFGWPRNDWIDYTNYVDLLPPRGGALGLYEREGFAATVAALEEAGGRPLSPLAKRDWGEEAAWFADPDGNVVAVAQTTSPGDSQLRRETRVNHHVASLPRDGRFAGARDTLLAEPD
jgi:predicted enzyme related to lactoylglutathione lyase